MRFGALGASSFLTVVAAISCGCSSGSRTLDPQIPVLEQSIEDMQGFPVTVVCPDSIPLAKGKIANCTVSASGQDTKVLRLTQDDDEGNYTWEITPQDAP